MMSSSVRLPFVKMQATGNDFVLISSYDYHSSGTRQSLAEVSQLICDRHFGIGSDGLLIVTETDHRSGKPSIPEMLFFNPDGSGGRMCGNGARCFSKYLMDKRLSSTGEEVLLSQVYDANEKPFELEFCVNRQNYRSTSDTNDPDLISLYFEEPVEVTSFDLDPLFAKESTFQPHIGFIQQNLKGCFRSNPGTDHLILYLEGIEGEFILPDSILKKSSDLRNRLFDIAKAIRYNSIFGPDGINVNFALQTSSNCIELLTYERGVEQFTLSCGTGTIATALSFILSKRLFKRSSSTQLDPSETVTIRTDGGTLTVEGKIISLKKDPVYHSDWVQFESVSLTGPARFVAEGSFMLPL